jgi:alkane 1-monooxygenase
MFSSDSSDSWLFRAKPKTLTEYWVFTAIFGFFTGLNTIAGHELLHRKELHNKIIGTFAYTKFFYTHFLDEHIKGHHKSIATLEDPATCPKNMSIYGFIVRSVTRHVSTIYNRETTRI